MIEEKIASLLSEKFQEEEFSDCFLIEIALHANQKLNVFMDSDSGVTFAKCQKISRYLENIIETEGWLGAKYTLEVSSPGIGRPLKLNRQYPKNVGRKVEVFLKNKEKIEGLLTTVEEDTITLEQKVRVKEGKKKKTKLVQHIIRFEDIEGTIVKISF